MTSTYRSAGMSVEAVATRAAEKILPEGVEIFLTSPISATLGIVKRVCLCTRLHDISGCLFYPWGYVFVNKVAEWRRPLYLFGLNLRGQVYQINYPLKLKFGYWGFWGNGRFTQYPINPPFPKRKYLTETKGVVYQYGQWLHCWSVASFGQSLRDILW